MLTRAQKDKSINDRLPPMLFPITTKVFYRDDYNSESSDDEPPLLCPEQLSSVEATGFCTRDLKRSPIGKITSLSDNGIYGELTSAVSNGSITGNSGGIYNNNAGKSEVMENNGKSKRLAREMDAFKSRIIRKERKKSKEKQTKNRRKADNVDVNKTKLNRPRTEKITSKSDNNERKRTNTKRAIGKTAFESDDKVKSKKLQRRKTVSNVRYAMRKYQKVSKNKKAKPKKSAYNKTEVKRAGKEYGCYLKDDNTLSIVFFCHKDKLNNEKFSVKNNINCSTSSERNNDGCRQLTTVDSETSTVEFADNNREEISTVHTEVDEPLIKVVELFSNEAEKNYEAPLKEVDSTIGPNNKEENYIRDEMSTVRMEIDEPLIKVVELFSNEAEKNYEAPLKEVDSKIAPNNKEENYIRNEMSTVHMEIDEPLIKVVELFSNEAEQNYEAPLKEVDSTIGPNNKEENYNRKEMSTVHMEIDEPLIKVVELFSNEAEQNYEAPLKEVDSKIGPNKEENYIRDEMSTVRMEIDEPLIKVVELFSNEAEQNHEAPLKEVDSTIGPNNKEENYIRDEMSTVRMEIDEPLINVVELFSNEAEQNYEAPLKEVDSTIGPNKEENYNRKEMSTVHMEIDEPLIKVVELFSNEAEQNYEAPLKEVDSTIGPNKEENYLESNEDVNNLYGKINAITDEDDTFEDEQMNATPRIVDIPDDFHLEETTGKTDYDRVEEKEIPSVRANTNTVIIADNREIEAIIEQNGNSTENDEFTNVELDKIKVFDKSNESKAIKDVKDDVNSSSKTSSKKVEEETSTTKCGLIKFYTSDYSSAEDNESLSRAKKTKLGELPNEEVSIVFTKLTTEFNFVKPYSINDNSSRNITLGKFTDEIHTDKSHGKKTECDDGSTPNDANASNLFVKSSEKDGISDWRPNALNTKNDDELTEEENPLRVRTMKVNALAPPELMYRTPSVSDDYRTFNDSEIRTPICDGKYEDDLMGDIFYGRETSDGDELTIGNPNATYSFDRNASCENLKLSLRAELLTDNQAYGRENAKIRNKRIEPSTYKRSVKNVSNNNNNNNNNNNKNDNSFKKNGEFYHMWSDDGPNAVNNNDRNNITDLDNYDRNYSDNTTSCAFSDIYRCCDNDVRANNAICNNEEFQAADRNQPTTSTKLWTSSFSVARILEKPPEKSARISQPEIVSHCVRPVHNLPSIITENTMSVPQRFDSTSGAYYLPSINDISHTGEVGANFNNLYYSMRGRFPPLLEDANGRATALLPTGLYLPSLIPSFANVNLRNITTPQPIRRPERTCLVTPSFDGPYFSNFCYVNIEHELQKNLNFSAAKFSHDAKLRQETGNCERNFTLSALCYLEAFMLHVLHAKSVELQNHIGRAYGIYSKCVTYIQCVRHYIQSQFLIGMEHVKSKLIILCMFCEGIINYQITLMVGNVIFRRNEEIYRYLLQENFYLPPVTQSVRSYIRNQSFLPDYVDLEFRGAVNHPVVMIPANIYAAFCEQHVLNVNAVSSIYLWGLINLQLDRPENRDFFRSIDACFGRLSAHSSLNSLLHYMMIAIDRLYDYVVYGVDIRSS